MRGSLALLVLLSALAGCATARVAPLPAHGSFEPTRESALNRKAIDTLGARGFEVAFHDPARGLVVTRVREGQAPCGASTCMARDNFVVRLFEGSAVAVLSRQLFDPALRAWAAPTDPQALDAVEAEEVGFLRALLDTAPTLRLSRAGESCSVDSNCSSGCRCDNRRCREATSATPPARPAPAGRKP